MKFNLNNFTLKVSIKNIIKDGFWLVLSNIIISIVNLIYLILLSNILEQEVLGKYQFFIMTLSIVSIFSLNGIVTSTTISASRGNYYALIDGFKYRFKYSLIGSFILLFISFYLLYYKKDFWISFLISSIFFPFFNSLSAINLFFFALNKYKIGSIIKTIINIFPPIVVVTVIYFINDNINILLLVYVISISLIYIILGILLYKYIKRKSLNKNYKKDGVNSLKYGKKLSYLQAFNTLTSFFDKYLLTYFLGFEILAIYYIAETLPNVVKNQIKVIYSLLLPRFSRYNFSKKHLLFLFLIGWFISFLIGVITYLIIPYIIKLFFSEKYISSIYYSELISLGIIFWIPTLILLTYFESKKMLKELFFHKLIIPIISIIIYPLLLYYYKLIGLIYAKLFIFFFETLLLLFLSKIISFKNIKKIGRAR